VKKAETMRMTPMTIIGSSKVPMTSEASKTQMRWSSVLSKTLTPSRPACRSIQGSNVPRVPTKSDSTSTGTEMSWTQSRAVPSRVDGTTCVKIAPVTVGTKRRRMGRQRSTLRVPTHAKVQMERRERGSIMKNQAQSTRVKATGAP